MKMKKIVNASLILLLILNGITGCGSSEESGDVEVKLGEPFELDDGEYTYTAIRNDGVITTAGVISTLEIDVIAKNTTDDVQSLGEIMGLELYDPEGRELESGDFYLSKGDNVYSLDKVLTGYEKQYTLGFENPQIDGEYQLIYEEFSTNQKYIFRFTVENLPQEEGGTTITYEGANGQEKYQAFPTE